MLRFVRKTFLFLALSVGLATFSAYAGPKILLIHGSVGMGHTAAANGIAADIKLKNPNAEVIIKDLRDFMDPAMKKIGNDVYDVLTKYTPQFYDETFRDYMDSGARVLSIGDMSLTDQFHPEKVLKYVDEVVPDVIISTFPSATEVLVRLRDKGQLTNTPIGWVHTDLVDETYFARMPLQIDMAFVATPRLEKSWVKRGVPDDRVIASGMPLNPEVLKAPDPVAVAAFRAEKGLKTDTKTILILGGSNGVGDYKLMVEKIVAEFPNQPLQIVAVCGRSKQNFKALAGIKQAMAKVGVEITIEELVKQPVLFKYMESSDVIVSKTGGLTPMELFYKRKPLVLLDINGGQERYNANDFSDTGLATVTRDQREVGREVKALLSDPALAQGQIQKQIEFSQTNQPGKIADWALSKPTAKEALNKSVYLDMSPDYPRPKGLFWDCRRVFKRAVLTAPAI